MTKRDVLIAVLAAALATLVSFKGLAQQMPPPPTPPPEAPAAPAPRPVPPKQKWDTFCIDKERAGVTAWSANADLYKKDGWNLLMKRYASDGWEPFQLIVTGDNIHAVCFKKLL